MKKWISMLLCLLLMAAPMSALAAEGDLIVSTANNDALGSGIRTAMTAGDALYMMLYGPNNDEDQLAVHRVGDTEMTVYPIQIGEPLDRENAYSDYKLLADGDVPLVLRLVTRYGNGEEITKAELYGISLEGGAAIATLRCEPDWEIFHNDQGYYNYIESVTSAGGYALFGVYEDEGQTCYRMDLKSGEIEKTDLSYMGVITSYVDGKALTIQNADRQYTGEGPISVRIVSYDPATGEGETLCEREYEEYTDLSVMCCDAETGKVYVVQNGELFEFDVTTGETGESVTDVPTSIYSGQSCGVLKGGYFACTSYDAYALRNLNPGERPETRLKICDNSYSDLVNKAYYEFVNAHGDVTTILSHEYLNDQGLIDAMMNRESDVDVYIMSAGSSGYEALYDRGYMADFSESEKLKELAAQIHPGLLDQLSVNGQFSALPVNFTFWMMYVDEVALEKIGLTVDELPTNWLDFMDFLVSLEGRMPEDGSVRLCDPYTADVYARRNIFDQIFQSYQNQLRVDANACSAQQMTEILNKLGQIDFLRLGQPTEEETSSENYNPEWLEHGYILEMNMGSSIGGITQNYSPMVMSMTPDTPRLLATDAQIAFINPFSENRAQALEFVEQLAEGLDDQVTYVLCEGKTEPALNVYYEEGLQNMQEYVERLKQQLEEAEEVDRQSLEEELQRAEEHLADYDRYRYSISERDIAWMQENASYLTIMGPNWLYGDDAGDAYELVQQYAAGKISAEKLMNEIDRKIRMMMMEGY